MLVLGDDSVQVAMSVDEVRHRVRVDVRPESVDARPAGTRRGAGGHVLTLDDVLADGRLAVGQWRLPGERHRVAQDVADG